MPKAKSTFAFKAPLTSVKGAFISAVIYIPQEIMKMLPKGRVRVKGTMNLAPFALAVQYRRSGKSFFTVSAGLRRAAKIKVGDSVSVQFKLVDPDKVDLPEELEAVLAQDDEGMRAWQTMTPGLQRSVALYVRSVKNVDSRISRALLIVNKAKQGYYTSARNKNKST